MLNAVAPVGSWGGRLELTVVVAAFLFSSCAAEPKQPVAVTASSPSRDVKRPVKKVAAPRPVTTERESVKVPNSAPKPPGPAVVSRTKPSPAMKRVRARSAPLKVRRPKVRSRPRRTVGRRSRRDSLDDLLDGAVGSRPVRRATHRRATHRRATHRRATRRRATHRRATRRRATRRRATRRRAARVRIRRTSDPLAGLGLGGGAAPRPSSSTGPAVKAGSADDNLQFNAFLSFLETNGRLGLPCAVWHRIVVSVEDREGLPVPNAIVSVTSGQRSVAVRRTYADGRTLLFPSQTPALRRGAVVRVHYRGRKVHQSRLETRDSHHLRIVIPNRRVVPSRVPLDIAFILDTTGSMGDEIERLKRTLGQINDQISRISPRPEVRFGMVLYRDQGDDYRVKLIPFTSDVQHFAARLQTVRAGGGGDNPEDVQAALQGAIQQLDWRSRGIRLAILLGDAPPHLDYGQSYTYTRAMQDAAKKGIKIATIGASGLNRAGELVWRQIAQYTMSPFVFLTHGEKGDSEGSPSSVSHHVGSNWVAENLDAIVVRLVKVELGHYAPTGSPVRQDYFSAVHRPGRDADDVLRELFQRSTRQLTDYAVQRILARTPTLILPMRRSGRQLRRVARRLERQLSLSIARSPEFQLLARRNLPAVTRLQTAQLSLRYDKKRAVALGKLTPARLAVFSELASTPRGIELLVKLVRLKTGEVVSLSLLRVDRRLLAEMS